MARRGRPPSPFGLAFVDTLTCALGSLLLFWMALGAIPPGKPGVAGKNSPQAVKLQAARRLL